MECPFCRQPMESGHVRARGYATTWSPAASVGSRLPPPFDAATRGRRHEAIVVSSHDRPAHRCPSCEAILISPPTTHP
jgi:hypothetical protein